MNRGDFFFDESIKKIAKRKIVVDCGGANPFQKELAGYKALFDNSIFITLDLSDEVFPTVKGDAHSLPFKSNCIDAMLSKAVLEHVYNPFVVLDEMYRVLKPGGVAYLWVPFLHSYHPRRDYEDFFRFTKDGIKLLTKKFKSVEIEPVCGYFETLANLLPQPLFSTFIFLGRFADRYLRINNQNMAYHVFLTK